MEILGQDIRFALRMMLAKPAFTLAAILALAFGIGANTAIFTIINSVLLKPLPYSEPQNLVTLSRGFKEGSTSSVSLTKFLYWKQNNHSLQDLAAYDQISAGCNLTGAGQPERVSCIRVSAGFFRVLGREPIRGRSFLPEEDRPGGERVVIVSHGFSVRRFGGDTNAVGQTLNIAGEPYTIVGVAQPNFSWEPKADLWTP